jgi:membrane-associated phospholipid phosphatase
MPLLLLLALALTAGVTVGLITWRAARTPSSQTLDAAREVGKAVGRHPRLRARLDPSVATGLALTLALVVAVGGGVLFGVLAYLVRSNAHLAGIDNSVARWGNTHATATSMHVLNVVTRLGSIYTVLFLCVVLAVAETIRERTVWVIAFIVAVMSGQQILTLTVKALADRLRPTFNPAAATLGPSFPSGHSSTAAAFFAALALLAGRRRSAQTRSALAGVAAGLAVAVASSRVLLDLHWVSDVVAGLALGWGWFAVCAIAFGGSLVRLGAPVEAAAQAEAEGSARRPSASTRECSSTSASASSPGSAR